jgi:hypothetical protein
MKKLKPYIPILYKLIIDLVLLGCEVMKQVILPNRKRKGNLLSSLFLLFAGLTDCLITFRQNMTTLWTSAKLTAAPWVTTSWIYGKKYIRQGMIIATWVLFILSSFEWSGPVQSLPAQNQQKTTESVQLSARKTTPVYAASSCFDCRIKPSAFCEVICQSPLPSPQHIAKTWLRLCTLRI